MQRGDGVDFPIGKAIIASVKSALGPGRRPTATLARMQGMHALVRPRARPLGESEQDLTEFKQRALITLSHYILH